MSRIENILEKAALMREGKATPEHPPAKCLKPAAAAEVFLAEKRCSIDNPYLVTMTDVSSPITEEYKKLKSVLLRLTNSGSFKNTVMITSAISGEGKSITAINLAMTLAQEYDHTVLLVDADLRRPSITEYLGIRAKLGLTDCLVKDAEVSDVLVKTGIGKLVVLPAGSKVDNPAELLSSSKMQAFVKELKHRYQDRYVIFDTPPVLSFSEAHSLGSLVDGVIFIVKEGGATKHNIMEALNGLKSTNVLGLVYNNAEISRFDANYRYKSYDSYYRYGGK